MDQRWPAARCTADSGPAELTVNRLWSLPPARDSQTLSYVPVAIFLITPHHTHSPGELPHGYPRAAAPMSAGALATALVSPRATSTVTTAHVRPIRCQFCVLTVSNEVASGQDVMVHGMCSASFWNGPER